MALLYVIEMQKFLARNGAGRNNRRSESRVPSVESSLPPSMSAVRNDKGVTREFMPYLQSTVTLEINRGDSPIRRNRNDRLDGNARFVIAIQVGVDDSVA